MNKKGIVLVAVVLLIVIISVYLASYSIWVMWDQKNLSRDQLTDSARDIAQAGLNRAEVAFSLDSNSWLDGDIAGTSVGGPNLGSPDTFYPLYSGEPFGGGNYTVEIDYLQNPRNCSPCTSFIEKRIRVRSKGTVGQDSVTLEKYISWGVVKNLTQIIVYGNLQPAMNDANDSDILAITEANLNENINIAPPLTENYTITGGYDSNFTYRAVEFDTVILGSIQVGANANITLRGIKIQ